MEQKMMGMSELNILELEYGNFDNALDAIILKASTGNQEYIRLLADIYKFGIGVQKDEVEYLRLTKLLGTNNHVFH
jgi:hypothetical protein